MQKDLRKSALWRHRRKISPDAPIEKFSFTEAYGTSLVYEEYRKKAERELGNGIDGSMIDASFAMRMRLDGHAKGDAINAIYRNSPWAAERSTREDKIEYVQHRPRQLWRIGRYDHRPPESRRGTAKKTGRPTGEG